MPQMVTLAAAYFQCLCQNRYGALGVAGASRLIGASI